MSSSLPFRRGLSKRTHERVVEDVVTSAMNLTTANSCLSTKRIRIDKAESKIIEPKVKTKQVIEILDVQVLNVPYNNSCRPLLTSNESCDTLFQQTDSISLISEIIQTGNQSESYNFSFTEPKLTKDQELERNLRNWSIKYNASASALSALLVLMINYGLCFLPKDSRTFKNTPKEIVIRNVEPGIYWHYGIKRFLSSIFVQIKTLPKILSLNIFVDGLPIGKSSKGSFWTILGKFKEIPLMQPFVIGLYYHINLKPKCPKMLLKDVIRELLELERGEFMGKTIKVNKNNICF